MRNLKIIYITFFAIASFFIFPGCEKYLDKKPDLSLAVPSTLADLRALLDGETMNGHTAYQIVSSDDIFADDISWASFGSTLKNVFIWENIEANSSSEWSSPYRNIFYSNTVLDLLSKIKLNTDQERNESDHIKGSALFYRADNYFQLSQNFCEPYNATSADALLGLPLRLNNNVQEVETRANLKETYDQILFDLNEAFELLPEKVISKNRPSKVAAKALLARIYLSMELYDKALASANDALQMQSDLLTYSELPGNPSAIYIFPRFNAEVIYHSQLNNYGKMRSMFIDSTLISTYDTNDLRLSYYFINTNDGHKNFKNSYTGDYRIFSGLATDELYLIKSECLARSNKITEAIQTLNTFLETRWKPGTFVPYVTADADSALDIILNERRKSLVYRGQRWSDLRRLNNDTRTSTTIKRVINGVTYQLTPNDPKYVFLIPQNEIELSGIEQNPR